MPRRLPGRAQNELCAHETREVPFAWVDRAAEPINSVAQVFSPMDIAVQLSNPFLAKFYSERRKDVGHATRLFAQRYS